MTTGNETEWILDELLRIEATSQTDLFVDSTIVETDGGVIIFLPDRLRLRGILKEWAQGHVEDMHSRAGYKLDPNQWTHRETGEKATPEEAAEVENNVKEAFAKKIYHNSIKLWGEHLSQGLSDAISQLLDLVHLRAFLDWMSEEDAPTSSEAHYFDQLLKTINARVKERFQRRTRGGSRPRIEDRSSIRSRYTSLCLKIKSIKKHYNLERETFERNNRGRGFNEGQWQSHWLQYAQDRFPDEDVSLLGFFTDPDNYESSVAGIAYKQLAGETGYSVEYVKKLASNSGGKRRNPKRIVKPIG